MERQLEKEEQDKVLETIKDAWKTVISYYQLPEDSPEDMRAKLWDYFIQCFMDVYNMGGAIGAKIASEQIAKELKEEFGETE